MKRSSILVCMVLAALVLANSAFAQATIIPPGTSQFSPLPPSPPPPPKIQVPVVPELDAPTPQIYQLAARPSFSDQMTSCLDEGAAAGLGPGQLPAFSRMCANQ
jgi:hypothetical protein